MINLNIKGYCEDCPHFEAETIGHIVGTDGYALKVDNEIRCKHAEACEYAISHVFSTGKGE